MKILVCISHVPDTTTKIQFEADKKGIIRAGVTYIINPYDEYGLSRAIGFKEEGKSIDAITAIAVGGPEVEPTLRKALAIGATEAVRVDAEATDAFTVATEIAEYAREREFDIIFTGKESIDFNGAMVPGMVAEMLDYPFISFATYMEVDEEEGTTILHREVDGGYEVVESELPVVVSCQKGIAEWRIPNMRGIMAARKKPLARVNSASGEARVTTDHFEYPPAKGDTRYIDPAQPQQLISALVEKGII
ncbi:MAG: electron transfer flavoprotein subunit beta/FixA family protein [Bacteroidia bacterium]